MPFPLLLGMALPWLVVGHKTPDTDSILSALALADLLRQQGHRAEAIAQGAPNPETAYVLRRCGLQAPPVRRSVARNPVLLVDHSDPALAPDDLQPDQLVGIVDHHKLGGMRSEAPLTARIEPVGSTATLVVALYKEAGKAIPRPLACGLLAAVLSDTRTFQSPTTTARDRQAVALLSSGAGISDPMALGSAMLRAYATAMAQGTDGDLIHTDFKRFQMGSHGVGISQIEAPDIGFVRQRRASLLRAMEEERVRLGLHSLLLMATDVPLQGSELLVVSTDPPTVERALKIRLSQGSAWVPGMMSRKLQVVPPLQAVFR
jgi:manganese-dependent inorganic pyrophosphatase